jgi:hypothetical protein
LIIQAAHVHEHVNVNGGENQNSCAFIEWRVYQFLQSDANNEIVDVLVNVSVDALGEFCETPLRGQQSKASGAMAVRSGVNVFIALTVHWSEF